MEDQPESVIRMSKILKEIGQLKIQKDDSIGFQVASNDDSEFESGDD